MIDIAVIVAEKSLPSIDKRISQIAIENVREHCCANSQCEGLCNTAMHEYRMLYIGEWAKYTRGN
jgi:hypothetical protein